MTTYAFPLLGLVSLCVFWAAFQLWLRKVDPEGADRGNRCGGCDGQCDGNESLS